MVFLLAVAPECRHLFERLALGLGHKGVDEPCSKDTDRTVEGVDEDVSETLTHVACTHVVHRHERGRHDEVEDPLECNGYCHSRTADRVGEYLGDEHPADRSP